MNKIETALNKKKIIARRYDVEESQIVWIGNKKFIVVKNNEEIKINF